MSTKCSTEAKSCNMLDMVCISNSFNNEFAWSRYTKVIRFRLVILPCLFGFGDDTFCWAHDIMARRTKGYGTKFAKQKHWHACETLLLHYMLSKGDPSYPKEDPIHQVMRQPIGIHPNWNDFSIGGFKPVGRFEDREHVSLWPILVHCHHIDCKFPDRNVGTHDTIWSWSYLWISPSLSV